VLPFWVGVLAPAPSRQLEDSEAGWGAYEAAGQVMGINLVFLE